MAGTGREYHYSAEFPDDIAYGARSIPGYFTDVITVQAKHEHRDQKFDYPRTAYDVSYGIRDTDDLIYVLNFFHACSGRGIAFRFKDWADYKSCNTDESISALDQLIGVGDGSEDEYQLIKTYTKGALSRTRRIQWLPDEQYYGEVDPNTQVIISVDDVTLTYEDDWDYDPDGGMIYFVSPPGNGLEIKAGYEFYVPCRFDTDRLIVSLDTDDLASAQIPIVEVFIESWI